MVILKRAKEADIASIQKIAKLTWDATYLSIIGSEQTRYMLNKMYNTAVLNDQMQDGHIFLIAESNQKDMGFAAYSLTDVEARCFKLQKLYVLPEAHGQGLGNLLLQEVINQIKQQNGKTLKLNVNRQNRALSFYEKNGFTIKESRDIDIGNGFFMNDYIMELSLI